MKLLVLLPTYNEALNLKSMVRRIAEVEPTADILILDDNSPDGTGVLAEKLASFNPQIFVKHRPLKEGLGAAYIEGFQWGIERNYDRFTEIDCDGSHPPEALPKMMHVLDTSSAGLVIGSRWVPGGSVRNWPWKRQFLSRGANLYTRIALGLSVKDATGGFRTYTRAALEKIDWSDLSSRGYFFQVEMTYRLHQAGISVVEIPIEFVERELGKSKMSGGIIVEAMAGVTSRGAQRILARAASYLRYNARYLRRRSSKYKN
jgi:dolichol-phosphate mannosyltransferase